MPAPHHPPSSSPDQPSQWFLFGPWAFDITAATAIIRDEPRETVTLPVVPWARAYGLARDPGSRTARGLRCSAPARTSAPSTP